LLSTLEPAKLMDFILYIFEQEEADELWQTWVNKDFEISFKEFKDKYFSALREPKEQTLKVNDEAIKTNVSRASQFIKQRKEE